MSWFQVGVAYEKLERVPEAIDAYKKGAGAPNRTMTRQCSTWAAFYGTAVIGSKR